MTTSVTNEGKIPFRGYHTWYRIVGEGEATGKRPLLVLHGGPGVTHDYLLPLEALADTGRRVIFYDQLGNGRSDQPKDPSLWTRNLFLDELATVREALDLKRVHLLGHSWGGMLALDYLLTRPAGVLGLILANSLSSEPLWSAETNRLRGELPIEVESVLARHEADGTTDDPAYQEAVMAFYKLHLLRVDPWPDYVLSSFQYIMANPEVYNTLWGNNEFTCNGTLRGWDITDRLGEITTPTLILSGRYDESTPAVNELLQRGIAGSEWVLFEEGSHFCHIEETERYLKVVTEFLDRQDARFPA